MEAEEIVRQAEKLFSTEERTNAESVWELISEFITPNQFTYFKGTKSKGAKTTQRIFDSTAIQANHDLASIIHSTLTNPATKWARFRFTEEQLNDHPESSAWLEDCNNRYHDAITASNFSNEIARAYQLYPALGSMVIMQEAKGFTDEGKFGGFHFKAWHQAEVAWSENMYGEVDIVYRRFKLTARQAYERWGTKLDKAIIESCEKDPEKEYEFYHAIFPRNKKMGRDVKVPKERPYASVYVSKLCTEILEENGYYEFPVRVVRWGTSPGEVYGRGPAHIALPDVRSLNKMLSLTFESAARSINPPILAQERALINNTFDIRPGSVNIVRDINGFKELISNQRVDMNQFTIELLVNRIKSIFYLDKLFLPDRRETGEMTAFEISVRTQQLQAVIGPTLGRLDTELLNPLVSRGFNMMLRGNAFAPMPQILKDMGASIEVEYVNSLARSQKIEDVTAISQWIQEIGMLAQIKPEVVDVVDADEVARLVAKRRGVPEIAVASKDTVDASRQQRAQMQQQQMALESGVQMADIASKMPQGESTDV